MATYNAYGVDVDGIPTMKKAISDYQGAIDKALNTITKTHQNTTLLNNAMKGAGITSAYKRAEEVLKKRVNDIVSRLNQAQDFLDKQLKTAYEDGSKGVATSAFSGIK